MAEKSEAKGSIVSLDQLPKNYPTQSHSAEFWEALGRAIATYGFLEEVLAKAIFAFTGTREVPEEGAAEELEKWQALLEKALKDSIGGLITSYEAAVKSNSAATTINLDDLISELRKAATIRNVLCHGSWREPNSEGKSVPHFVDRKLRVFTSEVDAAYLHQVQRRTIELTCAVINTVTSMGWQFPGSASPGKRLW